MRTEKQFGRGHGLGGPEHHVLQDEWLLGKLHTVTEGQGWLLLARCLCGRLNM